MVNEFPIYTHLKIGRKREKKKICLIIAIAMGLMENSNHMKPQFQSKRSNLFMKGNRQQEKGKIKSRNRERERGPFDDTPKEGIELSTPFDQIKLQSDLLLCRFLSHQKQASKRQQQHRAARLHIFN